MLRLLGVRRASAWAAAGAAAYSLGQFLSYVFVAKLCSVEVLGRFALAVAWVTPVMLAARMQLRYVLAAGPGPSLGLAAQARAITAGLAILSVAGCSWLWASPETAWALILVALIRAAEDAGDLLLGVAQRADDWPLIARSLALRGLGGALAFGLALVWGAGLTGGLAATLLWQTAVTALHDWPGVRSRVPPLDWQPWRRAMGSVRAHAALGGAAALVSLNAYVPRYAADRFLGIEAVGIYTALAQLSLIGNMAVQAIGQAAVGPLGVAFRTDQSAFLKRVAGLAALAGLTGAAGLVAAATAGPSALGLVYRPEYAQYGGELVWLTAAAALTYVTAVLGYALVAAGERSAQLWVFSLSTLVSLVASLLLTPVWGLRGAALALVAAWAVAAAGVAVALVRRLRACPREEPCPTLSPWQRTDSARPGAVR